MKVVFRTDASLQIGTGHVMRCLTLANALRTRGAECRFICREHPGNLNALIRQHGHEVYGLPVGSPEDGGTTHSDDVPAHAAWLGVDWDSDANQTQAAIDETMIDWLIVDHYALDSRWEATLRPHCRKLMVIDDLADRSHDCDLLLDQNLVADWQHRYQHKVPADCGLLLGPEYALLQPQYAELYDRVPPCEGPIRRVLVYFGGADNDNLTGTTIAAFLSLKRSDIALDVVINPAGPHATAIRRQSQGNTQISLHEGLPSLAPLMVKADLAIGAGGTTSWERCCLGLPSLVITLADNQKPIAAELNRQGLVRWLGHKNEVGEVDVAQALREVMDDGLIAPWSEQCRQHVDGQGVARVSAILTLNAQTPLHARLARLDDEERIFQWANDPLVRKNAFNPDSIDPLTHRTWFQQRLRDLDNCRMYVVETDDELPVGQVRFERSNDEWEVHYALDAAARGYGLGKQFLKTAMLSLRESTGEVLLFGRVRESNETSRKVFKGQGFESDDRGGEGKLSIAVCSDAGSWINSTIPELLLGWLAENHRVAWAHSANDLPGGYLCFFLSYERIVDAPTRARYRNNLVVHASDLPKGRGWSPASWLILEDANRIPVTLPEAVDNVDTGPIHQQEWLDLTGTELIDDWREMLAHTIKEVGMDVRRSISCCTSVYTRAIW